MKKISILLMLLVSIITFSGCKTSDRIIIGNDDTANDAEEITAEGTDYESDTIINKDVIEESSAGDTPEVTSVVSKRKLTPNDITITDPVSSSGDYIGPYTFNIEGDRVEISGTNSPTVTEIIVEFKNSSQGLSDIYGLMKFKQGDTEWKYVADKKYLNLGNGTNEYSIKAYSDVSGESKLVGEREIGIIAAIPEVTVDVPVGNQIYAEFLDKPKLLSSKDFFKSIGRSDKYDVFNKTNVESDLYTEEDIKIYEIGKAEEGIYNGSKILLIELPCVGMCSSSYYRAILNNKNQIITLKNISTSYIDDDYKDLVGPLLDEKTDILGLFPKNTISIPGSEYKLRREDTLYFASFDETDKEKAFYSNEIGQQLYFQKNTDCIIAKNADNTYSTYYIDFTFLNEAGSDDGKFNSMNHGKIYINWNDGSKTEDFYTTSHYTGCGRASCYDVADEEGLGDMVIKGKVDGQTEDVYEEEYSDNEIERIEKAIDTNENKTLSYLENAYKIFYAKDKPSFTEFFKAHPVIYMKDPFERLIRFTKQDYIPAVECGKPVIYLYPEIEVDVKVEVEPNGGFSITEPEYNSGWLVKANPLSEIYNYNDDTTYPYLFWEGKGYNYKISDKGFVVEDAYLEALLTEKLLLLGLNEKETIDFMDFWVEKIREQNKPYYFITFLPKYEFDQMAPLKVSPQPDSVIRVFMDYKGLDEKIDVEPLQIMTPERKGFTVVEWGGALRK